MVPEILHHLGQASVVAELKLGRLKLTVFLVAAGIGAAARRDLRNAEFQGEAAYGGIFARGHDQARIGNRQAQNRHQLQEILIADGMRRPGRKVGTDGGSMRGTLMVWQPTPKRSSRWAMCIIRARVS